jgi:hydrogenase maturation protease
MFDNTETLDSTGRILVMGIGNLLLGDDGLGIHAVRELGRTDLPDTVDLMDAGTAFLDAVSEIGDVTKIVIIDAVRYGKKPGTVYRIPIDPGRRPSDGVCLHGFSVIDTMKLARSKLPETVVLLGIEPESIDWTMELSHTVSKAMPLLIDAVLHEMFHRPERRTNGRGLPKVKPNPNDPARIQVSYGQSSCPTQPYQHIHQGV